MNARFMPDGQTIVFSATPTATTPNLYLISPDAEGPRELGLADAQLLAVSSRGELAVIENAVHLGQRLYKGTLARMTIGSSPRALADDVREADWAPDGDSLAIVRDLGNGRDRLEYPEGTALYEASGYLSDPRVSPDGNSVAFFEHQWRWDDRGWVKVVDRNKHVTTVTSELWGVQGLAWSADGSARRCSRGTSQAARSCSPGRPGSPPASRCVRSSACLAASSCRTCHATDAGWAFAKTCRSASGRSCRMPRQNAICRGSARAARATCPPTAAGF